LEVLLGIGASLAVLAVLLAKPPGWEALAVVLAALLPASVVLSGAIAVRRAREAQEQGALVAAQREALAPEALETGGSRSELQRRLAELVALNDLAGALSSTLDLDELLDRALDALVTRLPFDRALVLLVDDAAGVLTHGRSIGGAAETRDVIATV